MKSIHIWTYCNLICFVAGWNFLLKWSNRNKATTQPGTTWYHRPSWPRQYLHLADIFQYSIVNLQLPLKLSRHNNKVWNKDLYFLLGDLCVRAHACDAGCPKWKKRKSDLLKDVKSQSATWESCFKALTHNIICFRNWLQLQVCIKHHNKAPPVHRLLPRWPRLYRHPADIFQHNTTLSIYIPPPSIICLRTTQQPCVILHILNSDTGTTINFTLIMSQKVPKHSIITMLHIFLFVFQNPFNTHNPSNNLVCTQPFLAMAGWLPQIVTTLQPLEMGSQTQKESLWLVQAFKPF